MSRIARIVAQGYPHHVTQRGNYRQPVFETDGDYRQYLEWLKKYSGKYALDLWAYCLMSNHVHFICVPNKEDSLSLTFNTLHMRYAQYVNRRRQASGHLWQGRFFSSILDERHVYAAIRYVENNPVRARLVNEAKDYRWSSAREHLGVNSDGNITVNCFLTEEISDWAHYLDEKEDETILRDIRKETLAGRPCGDTVFIEKLEQKFGCRLQAIPRGRPKRNERK